jgi:hypothetical protein
MRLGYRKLSNKRRLREKCPIPFDIPREFNFASPVKCVHCGIFFRGEAVMVTKKQENSLHFDYKTEIFHSRCFTIKTRGC